MSLDVLDAALRAGMPAYGPEPEALSRDLQRAQASYLRAALGRTDLPITSAELGLLRQHAAYLDLKAEDAEPVLASDAWYVAATIYEWLSRLSPVAERVRNHPVAHSRSGWRPRSGEPGVLVRGPRGVLRRGSGAGPRGVP